MTDQNQTNTSTPFYKMVYFQSPAIAGLAIGSVVSGSLSWRVLAGLTVVGFALAWCIREISHV